MSEELRAGNVIPLHADKYTLVECHGCRMLYPYDVMHEPYFVTAPGKPHERLPICPYCAQDGCPLCDESLLDETDLTIDNVPERRACHADCVVSARRQAEEDK